MSCEAIPSGVRVLLLRKRLPVPEDLGVMMTQPNGPSHPCLAYQNNVCNLLEPTVDISAGIED